MAHRIYNRSNVLCETDKKIDLFIHSVLPDHLLFAKDYARHWCSNAEKDAKI